MRGVAALPIALLVLACGAGQPAFAGLSARLEECLGGDVVAGLLGHPPPSSSLAEGPLQRVSAESVMADLSEHQRERLGRIVEDLRSRDVGEENIEKFLGLFSRGCSVP